MKKNIFIDGEIGTTGLQVYEKLNKHPNVKILPVNQSKRKDVAYKKEMLELKQEYESTPTKSLSNRISHLDNQQMSIKILMNSLYGALGNNFFRYFDHRVAEAITTSGQLSIRWAAVSYTHLTLPTILLV